MRVFRSMGLATLLLFVASPIAAAIANEPTKGELRVIGHRGLLRHAPENTLAGFRACSELRIGFELDVRRSRDGRLVCLHDETLDRTTTGHGKVADHTLEELKGFDAGSWFDAAFRGEPLPTLDEVFATLATSEAPVAVAVDLKVDDDRLEVDVVGLARRHGVLDHLLMIGRAIDQPEVRRRLRASDAATHVACLANVPNELAAALADRDADWVYVRFLPSSEEVGQVHAAGKRVFMSGPKVAGLEEENWRQATRAGVDALLTDYPLELREQLRGPDASDAARQTPGLRLWCPRVPGIVARRGGHGGR